MSSSTTGLLFIAVGAGKLEDVRALLAGGANPNPVSPLTGFTPIHFAVINGHLDIVKALLSAGADPNQASDHGFTALHEAAHGHLDIVKALLAAGADPNQASDNGFTPLHEAAFFGHVEVVQALLEDDRIKPNLLSKEGRTATELAAQERGRDDIAALITAKIREQEEQAMRWSPARSAWVEAVGRASATKNGYPFGAPSSATGAGARAVGASATVFAVAGGGSAGAASQEGNVHKNKDEKDSGCSIA
jgi:ankyrin repeat protein